MTGWGAIDPPRSFGITPPSGDVSNRLATTAFVANALASALPGLHLPSTVVSSSPYTVQPTDFTLIVATGISPTVLNMPALGNNRVLMVINDNGESVNANSSTIFTPGFNTFSSNILLAQPAGNYPSWALLQDNGGGWVKIAQNLEVGWTSYTPVLGAQNNSSTMVTSVAGGLWRRVGTTVFFEISISSTNVGTASGFATVTVPFPLGVGILVGYGREAGVSGKMLLCTTLNSSLVLIVENYDTTSPIANGMDLQLQGFYASSAGAI